MAGSSVAGLLLAIFALTASAPPSRPDIRLDATVLSPPEASAEAGVSASVASASVGSSSGLLGIPSVFASVAGDDDWPTVVGMPRGSTVETLTFHEPTVRRCYSSSPNYEPGMPASALWVAMTVRGDGTVVSLETLEDGIGDAAVTGCIEKVLRKMHFRRSGGKDATVSMRWRF